MDFYYESKKGFIGVSVLLISVIAMWGTVRLERHPSVWESNIDWQTVSEIENK